MIEVSRMQVISAALIMIWLILLAWIAYQWLFPARLAEVAPPEEITLELPDVVADPTDSALAGLQRYDGLLERPLFYPDRRPPEPESEPEAVPEPPPPPPPDAELTLVGVVMMPEGMRALIKEDDSQRVSRLGPGDRVASWRLEELAGEQVTLSQGDRNRVLTLVRNQRQPTLERTPRLEIVPDASGVEETPDLPEDDAGDEPVSTL